MAETKSAQTGSKPSLSMTHLFLGGLVLNAIVLCMFPPMTDEQKEKLLRLPKTGEDIKSMYEVIAFYKEDHFWLVVIAFVGLYVNLQSFGVPGAAFFSVLSAPLFGPINGFIISHSASVLGAIICYCLSKQLGSELVSSKMPEKLAFMQRKIEENKANLFYYFLFLRVTPLVPNWFINLSSAVVGIPFPTYAVGTFIGIMPYQYVLVQMGTILDNVTSVGIDRSTLLGFLGLGFVSLIPTLFTKKEDMEEAKGATKEKTQ